MPPEISNKEAIEMMNRCKSEIASLRAEIVRLKPKADAYDNLAIVLQFLQRGGGMAAGEDLIWVLDKRIRELTPKPAEKAVDD